MADALQLPPPTRPFTGKREGRDLSISQAWLNRVGRSETPWITGEGEGTAAAPRSTSYLFLQGYS